MFSGPFVVVLLMMLVVWGGYFMLVGRHLAWEKVAEEMGLTLRHGMKDIDTEMSGTYRNRRVTARIEIVERVVFSSDRQVKREQNLVVRLHLNHPGWQSVVIEPRGFLGSTSLFKGQQVPVDFIEPGEVSIDNEGGFDRSFRVQGDVSQELKGALRRKEMQEALKELVGVADVFEISDGRIELRLTQVVNSYRGLKRLLERAMSAVEVLDRVEGGSGEVVLGLDETHATVRVESEAASGEQRW